MTSPTYITWCDGCGQELWSVIWDWWHQAYLCDYCESQWDYWYGAPDDD